MKSFIRPAVSALAMCAFVSVAGSELTLDTLRLNNLLMSQAVSISRPLMIDEVDVNSRPHDFKKILSLNPSRVPASIAFQSGVALPKAVDSNSVSLVSLEKELNVNTFLPGVSAEVIGAENYKVYVDDKEMSLKIDLIPGTHKIRVDFLLDNQQEVTPSISLIAEGISGKVSEKTDSKRRPSLSDFSDGVRIAGVSISPDGSMLLTNYTNTLPGGKTERYFSVTSTKENRFPIVSRRNDGSRWMPQSNLLYFTREGSKGKELLTFDPLSGAEKVLVASLPEGSLSISPTEDFAIITKYTEGPKEGNVYQILEPEDRQPGWRTRGSLLKVDFKTGAITPLTFGHKNTWLMDISDDGRRALLGTRKSRLEKRPTTVTTILSLDLSSMKADTIVTDDGFISSAAFSPDGSKILVSGTPEAFNRLGCTLSNDCFPSMTETELFLVDTVNPSEIVALTRDFDPSVNNFVWSRADGHIYITAEDRDYYHLYRLNPASGSIEQIYEPEDLVKSISLPRKGTLMAWSGQGASNPDRLYLTDLKSKKHTLVEEPSAERLAEVDIVSCCEWSFDNGRGDTIYCRYFLPADFDPAKKYPLIVNYYGGCSPTSRNFESRYPHNLYAAQGYGVLVIVPSGATGRGQEFASRHVNTAGQGVADDIIAGTKQFCEENPWVDASKIGCIGASYGGFMTQYLQTVTDLFAAAISHAGISDHTSYWGEGYWGYSYSEVSMADSYPWTRKDLYVDQSPLFRADKVNTPLLFLHGDSDNNVPVGESIQMFTALKLLGKETAFIAVADQDHHILDYDKRIKWQNTIFAWFEKYLKNDSSWWDALYPPKSL